ncbi:small nuclear RNA activating complex, subunit SNAP43-domain-containing protein [Circinella umbellata]|nr:small nuclear RNA activating complex, subunit SNAP43-domain-containing protein [Circinella umbellata]
MVLRSLNHPSSALEAADLIRIGRGQNGLMKLPICRDVDLLLANFGEQKTHSFKDFLDAWKIHNFSIIHFSAIDKESRPAFMQAFYDQFLEYFNSDVHYLRIGAMYGLYCLYMSQPSFTPPCPIRVTRDRWRIIFQFYIDGASSDDKEHASASFAFKKLLDRDAFVHVIQTNSESYNHFELVELKHANDLLEEFHTMRKRRIAQDAISACRRDDPSTRKTISINELSAKYQEAKNLVHMTPQATLAAQDLLHSMTGVKETNTKFLQNVLLKSSLSANESDFIKTLDNAERALWASRKRRIEQYMERPLNNKRGKSANKHSVETSTDTSPVTTTAITENTT